jgi:hypothetical protein
MRRFDSAGGPPEDDRVINDQTNPGQDTNACGPSESVDYVVTGDTQPTNIANSGGSHSLESGPRIEPVDLSEHVAVRPLTVDTSQQGTNGEGANTLSARIGADGIAIMKTTSNPKRNASPHSTIGGRPCNGRLVSLQQPSRNGSGTTHPRRTGHHRRNRII